MGKRDPDVGKDAHELASLALVAAATHNGNAKAYAEAAQEAKERGDEHTAVGLARQAREEAEAADKEAQNADAASKLAAYHLKDDSMKNFADSAHNAAKEAHEASDKAHAAIF
jgi:hypothetical protein